MLPAYSNFSATHKLFQNCCLSHVLFLTSFTAAEAGTFLCILEVTVCCSSRKDLTEAINLAHLK